MQSTPPQVPVAAEKTFTGYRNDQGARYAQSRPGYHPDLYATVLKHHTETGGKLDTILDVGCGPGTAVRALAPQFKHAIGLDPSQGMIHAARTLAGSTSTSEPIRFEVSTAEELGLHLSPPIGDASIDLITATTAAHWFDMERFWPSAARVLRPGGTVALWAAGDSKVHTATPNSAAIQVALDEIEERELVPFFLPGNWMVRCLYATLPLPWTLKSPIGDFDESTFLRKEWRPELGTLFPGGEITVDMETLEKILSTASPVQRWRDANPDCVGTEKDVTKLMRRATERLLHEAGVEKGKETLTGRLNGVLLMAKKKA